MPVFSESIFKSTKNHADGALLGHRPELFIGQKAKFLSALLQHKGEWIPAYRLASIALQYNARVKELRDAGYATENRIERVGRQVHGSFRLVSGPGEPETPNA
jgi:hypothetical protein